MDNKQRDWGNIVVITCVVIAVLSVIAAIIVGLCLSICISATIQFIATFASAMFGGVCTMLAIWISKKQTDQIQKENNALQDFERRKDFADSVVLYISKFIVEMASFLYNLREHERLNHEKARQQYIMNRSSFHPSTAKAAENEKEKIQQRIDNLPVDRTNATGYYHYLKMTLIDISEAQSLLEKLDNIHNSTKQALGADGDVWIKESLQAIQDSAIQFKKDYIHM